MGTFTISNTGGAWDNPTTWIGGGTPTVTDDVVATNTSGNLFLGSGTVANCKSFDLTGYINTFSMTFSNVFLNVVDVNTNGYAIIIPSNVNTNISVNSTIVVRTGKIDLTNHHIGTLRISSVILDTVINIMSDIHCGNITTYASTTPATINTNNYNINTRYIQTEDNASVYNLGTSTITFREAQNAYLGKLFSVIFFRSPTINGTNSTVVIEDSPLNFSDRLLVDDSMGTFNLGKVIIKPLSNNVRILLGKTAVINELEIQTPNTVVCNSGTTYTVNKLTALGTPSNHISLISSNLGTVSNFTRVGGKNSGCDYVDITDVRALGTTQWYVGVNSTGTASSTGWIYEDGLTTIINDGMMLGFVC